MTDPVTLAVIRGTLEQIADEMDLQLIRAALSPIISETNDCAHGIYHAVTGETIAQGSYGLPQFLANMQFTVQHVIKVAERFGGFRDGDVWIVNDPYCSGTHLQDVILVSPYFVNGELALLLANTGHWMDVGGSVPGGWVPSAENIHQEGFIIPPVRICENGELNQPLVDTIMANSRLAKQVRGDLDAMLNVFAVGRRGLDSLVMRYGLDTLLASMDETIRRSELEMRSHIEEIPDGIYTFDDCFDNDGVEDKVLPVRLAITVSGSDMTLDFAGTSPMARGPMNVSDGTAKSLCLVAIKHIFPEVPINGGTFRPIHFRIPQGSILSAEYPAPVGGTADVTQRIVDVVFGALAQAIPDKVPAAPFGTTGVLTISGKRADQSYYVAVFPYPGGYGGSRESDGLVNGTPPGSMAKFMSVEMSEHRYPFRFEYLGIREGSAGAGEHRGGFGTRYGITALADCSVSVLGDRLDHSPFGINGGGSASPNHVELVTEGKAWAPPMRSKVESVSFRPGDTVHLGSPGGGGFGPPTQRDPLRVLDDVNAGLIDQETAREVYAVGMRVARSGGLRVRYALDESETQQLRSIREPAQ